MNPVKEAAKLVGWLTASLAGLGAILYACGFLIVQTQLYMLGIHAFLPSGKEYYLKEGANFFIVTGQKLGSLLLGLIACLLVLCIPIILATKSGRGAMYWSRLQNCLASIHQRHQWLWQAAALLGMVLLLIYPLVHDLEIFRAPLTLSGLLYAPDDGTTAGSWSSDAHQIARWVLSANVQSLGGLYDMLLLHCLLAALFVAGSQRILSAWPLKTLIGLPFQLVFLIYVLLLPLDYVVLAKRLEFPAITLVSTLERVSNDTGKILLLYKTDQDFILWDQAQVRAQWVPVDKVAKIEIGPATRIFSRDVLQQQEERWLRSQRLVRPSSGL